MSLRRGIGVGVKGVAGSDAIAIELAQVGVCSYVKCSFPALSKDRPKSNSAGARRKAPQNQMLRTLGCYPGNVWKLIDFYLAIPDFPEAEPQYISRANLQLF